MTQKQPSIDWTSVEKALEQEGSLGYKMAVIETDKILNKLLEEKKFPGDSIDKKIQNIQSVFSNPDKLSYARAIHNKIISETNFEVSEQETQRLISAYYQAMVDVCQIRYGRLNVFTRIKFKISNLFRYKIIRWIKNIIVSATAFLIVVVLLNDTATGRKISLKTVELAHFVIYRFLLYFGIGVIAVFLIVTTVYYWEQKKNKYNIITEE